MKCVVFDFDGVLCEYTGWKGIKHIGEPIPEMIEIVEDLYDSGIVLKLSTARMNPKLQGFDNAELAGFFVSAWLHEQEIHHCFDEITGCKPLGQIYIDDRAFHFERGTFNKQELYGRINNLREIEETNSRT